VRLVADLRPLRVSRDLRILELGNLLSGLGTQAALVALPFQVYERTGSAFLTGLLGAAELGPIVVMGLWGGALADRLDRRTLLLRVQLGLFLTQAVLAAWTLGGTPPVAALYVLGGLLAGFGSVDGVARQSIIPNLVPRALLPSAVALNFGLFQATMVVGPGLGGLLIAGAGVGSAYAASAVGSLAMVLAASWIAPQPPAAGASPVRIRASIAEGLRFVNGNSALKGSFAIDLMAMTFGMPRALFPVLAVSVYGAGAAGTGLLFSSVSAGAVAAVLLTGWVQHARRLGVIVLWAVAVWGLGIAAAGLTTSLWVGGGLLLRRGRRRQRERRLPLDDQPDRHARPPARADVLRLPARGDGRAAPGRRGGGRRGRPRRAAVLRDLRGPGVPGRRGARGGRLPRARPLRRGRVARGGAEPEPAPA
jgi:MFS family permease